MLLDLLGLIGARAWIPKVSDQPRNLHEFNTFSIGPEGIAFQLGGEPPDRYVLRTAQFNTFSAASTEEVYITL